MLQLAPTLPCNTLTCIQSCTFKRVGPSIEWKQISRYTIWSLHQYRNLHIQYMKSITYSTETTENKLRNKGRDKTRLTYHVVENVSQCPGHCHGEEWQTEEHVVNEGYDQYVCDPHAFAVEVSWVWVGVAVSNSNIHCQNVSTAATHQHQLTE